MVRLHFVLQVPSPALQFARHWSRLAIATVETGLVSVLLDAVEGADEQTVRGFSRGYTGSLLKGYYALCAFSRAWPAVRHLLQHVEAQHDDKLLRYHAGTLPSDDKRINPRILIYRAASLRSPAGPVSEVRSQLPALFARLLNATLQDVLSATVP